MRSYSGDDGHDHGDDRGLDFASKESRSRHDRGSCLSSVCRLIEIR